MKLFLSTPLSRAPFQHPYVCPFLYMKIPGYDARRYHWTLPRLPLTKQTDCSTSTPTLSIVKLVIFRSCLRLGRERNATQRKSIRVLSHPIQPIPASLARAPFPYGDAFSGERNRGARLFRNSSAQDLCPEEAALCALDDLLVDALRGVVHDDGAGLVVDFGVDAGVADQVDDPLLAFVLGEAEAGGEVPVGEVSMGDVCALMTGEKKGSGSDGRRETYLMSIRWWILQ